MRGAGAEVEGGSALDVGKGDGGGEASSEEGVDGQ